MKAEMDNGTLGVLVLIMVGINVAFSLAMIQFFLGKI